MLIKKREAEGPSMSQREHGKDWKSSHSFFDPEPCRQPGCRDDERRTDSRFSILRMSGEKHDRDQRQKPKPIRRHHPQAAADQAAKPGSNVRKSSDCRRRHKNVSLDWLSFSPSNFI